MKICFVTHEGVPFSQGGPYIKIMEIKNYLEQLGHEVELFNMWTSTSRLKEFDIIHIVSANFALYNFARHLNYHGIKFILEPVFFSNHNTSFLQFFSNIDKMIRRIAKGIWFDYGFIRDMCEWATMVMPNTETEAEIISKGFSIPSEKIVVVQNGVSARFLNGDPTLFKEKYGIENFILNVGHIGPSRKNILALVKALSRIDQPAVIIGKQLKMGETPEVLIEAEKNNNLLLIDSLENKSPLFASAYAVCDTFVMPSMFETPGIAALEAGLAGCKIVITPNGGTKDYFKDMVEYVNPNSISSIKNGIEKSINQSRSEKLREHIKKNFLWEKVTEKTLDVYNKILDNSTD